LVAKVVSFGLLHQTGVTSAFECGTIVPIRLHRSVRAHIAHFDSGRFKLKSLNITMKPEGMFGRPSVDDVPAPGSGGHDATPAPSVQKRRLSEKSLAREERRERARKPDQRVCDEYSGGLLIADKTARSARATLCQSLDEHVGHAEPTMTVLPLTDSLRAVDDDDDDDDDDYYEEEVLPEVVEAEIQCNFGSPKTSGHDDFAQEIARTVAASLIELLQDVVPTNRKKVRTTAVVPQYGENSTGSNLLLQESDLDHPQPGLGRPQGA
jgi:hypothetical protein